jgi:hypothetical protein
MAVVQGSNPSLLRHVATGLRTTATVVAGVSTTYMTLATIETMKLRSTVDLFGAAENAVRQSRINDFMRKAKEYSEFSNAMMGAANSADAKATTQDAVSDASGFIPPTTDLPNLPDFPAPPLDDGPPKDPDPLGDLPNGGGRSSDTPLFGGGSSGLSGGDLGVDAGTEPYLGSASDGAPGPDAGADVTASSDESTDAQQQDGLLSLVAGGSVAAGVGAVAAASAGIAAGVLRANRRNERRHDAEGEEGERNGDRVEAVYQTGPPERPVLG